ncbi:unnamed protein product [Sphagnum troendelagicum]
MEGPGVGSPLARAVMQYGAARYKALRQDVEAQAMEVDKRMARNKETAGFNPKNTLKLQIAKQKLGELSASMAILGNEAAAAMTTVETQQQHNNND